MSIACFCFYFHNTFVKLTKTRECWTSYWQLAKAEFRYAAIISIIVTSLSFIIVVILRSEALIQNVDHFSAKVYDEQRKSSLRHDEKSYCTVLSAARF